MTEGSVDHMLKVVGERLRGARLGKGWSVREVSARSGVSERFVFAVEGGRANVSLKTLGQLTQALELSMGGLFAEVDVSQAPRRVIALLGMRGAGKSAVGPLLAQQLEAEFVELDERVEGLAGLPLADIFALHGAAHYEALQLQALSALLGASQRAVVATGGGIVTSSPALSLLRERARCVWLRASPLAHWERVIAQGDWRPIEGNPRAYEQLCATLEARSPLYAGADWIEETDQRQPAEVARGIAAWVERAAAMS